MTSNSEEQNNNIVTACDNLKSAHDLPDCINDLDLLYLSFVRSDIADSQKVREEITYSYECLKQLVNELKNIYSK